MADKKSDDYVVQIPGSSNDSRNNAAPRISPHTGPNNSLSKLDSIPSLSILGYCLASISMTVVNKYVVSGTSWNLHFLYLAIQSIVCSLAIVICKQAGLIKTLAPFSSDKAKRWFPISVLLVGQIYTGNKALQFLSVPVFTIFKNLTIIVIAYGEVLWFGGRVTPLVLLAFGLMVFSSIVAAWADIQAAISGDSIEASATVSTLNAGYAWMLFNVVCAASFVLGMRKRIKTMNFSDWDTMFYNNVLTIPVLVIGSVLVENWSVDNLERNFPKETRNSMMIGIVYSGLAAIFISYCSAWCIRVTSSTTYSMVGSLNKLPLAISGLVFFDAPITFGSISAIILAFVSGIIYTWGKARQKGQSGPTLPTTNQPVMSARSQSNKDAAN